jgi:hypothetical protein
MGERVKVGGEETDGGRAAASGFAATLEDDWAA